jgi:hypothetical protein
MLNGLALSHIITLYYTVRTMHGIYISYQFLSWLIISIYGIGSWIIYYIPKPSLQISHREMYYDIDEGDYIEIKKY